MVGGGGVWLGARSFILFRRKIKTTTPIEITIKAIIGIKIAKIKFV